MKNKTAKKKVNGKKKTNRAKTPGKVVLNFKVTPQEAKKIKGLARKFVRGNVTALIQQSLKYAPFHAAAFRKVECRASTRK